MKIVVKNSQLNRNTIHSINTLIEKDIEGSMAFRLARIIKHISSIVDDKVQSEKKIVDRYAKRDVDGNIIFSKDENTGEETSIPIIKEEYTEAFKNEISNLNDVENTLPYEKLDFDDLKISKINIKLLMDVDFLFN